MIRPPTANSQVRDKGRSRPQQRQHRHMHLPRTSLCTLIPTAAAPSVIPIIDPPHMKLHQSHPQLHAAIITQETTKILT